ENMSGLRILSLVAALVVSAAWGFIALASYPLLVIADSDLGIGAMKRVRDAGTLFLLSLAAAAVTCRLVPWHRLRLCLLAAIAGLVASCSFESSSINHQAGWSVLAVLGLTAATEYADARRFQGRPLSPGWATAMAVLTPVLLVLTDYHGR